MTLIASTASSGAPSADGTPASAQPPGSPPSPRNLWFDVLRALALFKIVTYHFCDSPLVASAVPSMGLMFAMAGSLMAGSLTRQKGRHYHVIARRLRRFLPPFWWMALLVVPAMLWHDWTATTSTATPARWSNLWLWVLPVSTPPGSDWGADWVVPLWYIRTYLWFVVVSPPTLWLWRRWPRQVYSVAPLVLVLMISGSLQVAAPTGDVVLDLATFGSCWLLGYAHHDGRLQAMPWRQVLPLGSALVAGGVVWAVVHPTSTGSWDVNEIPIAEALFSIGGALLLLRLNPRLGWLVRHRRLAGLATGISSRALTIYLWNNVAIGAAPVIIGRADDTALGGFLVVVVACLLLTLMVLAFGWLEDLAAGRRARLLPRSIPPPVANRASVAPVPAEPDGVPARPDDGRTPRTSFMPRPRTVVLTVVAVGGYVVAAWGVPWPGPTAADGTVRLTIPQLRSPSTPSNSPQPKTSITERAPGTADPSQPPGAAVRTRTSLMGSDSGRGTSGISAGPTVPAPTVPAPTVPAPTVLAPTVPPTSSPAPTTPPTSTPATTTPAPTTPPTTPAPTTPPTSTPATTAPTPARAGSERTSSDVSESSEPTKQA
jgi:peptidoglycan/LPS O-acetylase OafA/YrhL